MSNSKSAVQSLVEGMASGPCSCLHRMGSLSLSHDNEGNMVSSYDPGPVSKCQACIARDALTADGIPHPERIKVIYNSY